MQKSIYRGIRLDPATDRALRDLATAEAQGNASFLIRLWVQTEAKKRGVWPAREPAREAVRHVQTA
jgi:hypothetical protein